jgi:hypothetical protein
MKQSTHQFKHMIWIVICFLTFNNIAGLSQVPEKLKVSFIDYFFENASPLSWKMQGDTAIKVSLIADYERGSLNRQTDHWYFRVEADSGTHLKIVLSKMMADVYNGKLATNWWNFENDISCYLSYDQKTWAPIKTSRLPERELFVDFVMKGNSVYIARIPPYTITDLDNLKKRIVNNRMVKITNIGFTVEKRPLEIIQLGNSDALNSILIRARAHPWEPGGSWVLEGLIDKFLSENSKKWQETYCVYIMPMANKDGVAHGMTRFNISGKDLNRNWDKLADSVLCPEKFALEKFIERLIKNGKKPCLAIDIHNDDGGGINLASHPKDDINFIDNMKLFERLMREHTSFSEDMSYSWTTPGQPLTNVSFENGMLSRYGIEAIVYELNANWIGSLKRMPTQYDWLAIGENLNEVFYEYVRKLQIDSRP